MTSKQKADRISQGATYPSAKVTAFYKKKRYDKPKHLFKVLANRLSPRMKSKAPTLLDVGGGKGEFAYYMQHRFPHLGVTTLDSNQGLCDAGRKHFSACRFVCGDANDMRMFAGREFDVVTMLGALSVFTQFESSVRECIRVTRDKGIVVISSLFNEYPVDVLLRWRLSGRKGLYQTGLNMFAKESVGNFLSSQRRVRKWSFKKFHLPFDLKPQDDIIRTWTEFDATGKRIFKNGLGMEINIQILSIELR